MTTARRLAWLPALLLPKGIRGTLLVSLALVTSALSLSFTMGKLRSPRRVVDIALIGLHFVGSLGLGVWAKSSLSRTRQCVEQRDGAYWIGEVVAMEKARLAFFGERPAFRGVSAQRDVWLAQELIAKEEWVGARDLLLGIDRNLVLPSVRPMVVADLSLATTFAGDPGRGLVLAELALSDLAAGAPSLGPWVEAHAHGARIIALSSCGRHEEALEASLARGCEEDPPPNRFMSAKYYFEATSYEACGLSKDTVIGTLSIGETMGGPFGRRCAERLEALAPEHYN